MIAPPREPSLSGTVRLAVRVAGAVTITVAAVGVAVRLALIAPARHWLSFAFTGIPAKPVVAAGIFLHNLRALAAVFGALLIAQARQPTGRGAGVGVGAPHRALPLFGEAVLGVAVAANVVVLGAGLGAYGIRMVCAVLPHGPVELAAYALALALYLEGRTRLLARSHILAVAALSVSALGLAALLETFVNL
jgi:hypothetical protein